ncbi:glycosyltransferase family 10 domain-containing protein [Cerasicoccus arenae]|uniref:Alpha-(1,3)-fucosyltransferase FucT N-terminal domain-containing protein n=1 Tax=Cerasicoccus arenae TaxID=424488 RepID=A0A8J3DC03_9BACT|nr:glycosyltransferase family 10 [Cerasicoccus arenae]MBK1859187.1 hypothetical protein [Cerasicoccus arenae]GHC01146.1 hypothetical protein GCM10007047_16970 [Cerasicoccus arenae]
MRTFYDRYHLPEISLGFCRETMRGIAQTEPEKSWYIQWMLSRAFQLNLNDHPDFIFYSCGGNRQHLLNTSSIRIFTTGENIPPNWDEADYALTHERIYNNRHWRVPLWRHWYAHGQSTVMQDFETVKARVERFCNFIYSNDRALERIDFYDLLHARKHVHAGGKVRNNIGGRVEDKAAFIAGSKFTIAFENESHPGYSTEKIIQPLMAGSIPIYWGDSTITQDLNPNRFINVHDYPSFDAAIDRVLEIDQDDKLWEAYIREPLFRHDKIPDELSDEAILNFFHQIFSKKQPQIGRLKKLQQKSGMSLRESALKKNVNRVKNKIARSFGK